VEGGVRVGDEELKVELCEAAVGKEKKGVEKGSK